MMSTTLVVKHPGYKLVLGLLFLTTITSSLGALPSSHSQVVERQQRRQSIVNMRSPDRYGIAADGKTSNVASSPSSGRLSLGSDGFTSPESTVLQNDIRVAEKTLPGDQKRRWNSGNLRVWGKRQQREEGPMRLLPARAIDDEQAPAHTQSNKATVSQTSGEPRVMARMWDIMTPLRAWEKQQSESTKRSNKRN